MVLVKLKVFNALGVKCFWYFVIVVCIKNSYIEFKKNSSGSLNFSSFKCSYNYEIVNELK
ncbi:hypothetical protein BA172_01230 [Candidatus Portiera aleyrodidarum MED (Bemisia tabaci)]|nr:hypothetical protein BA172_01230 [Candidatus Portiera aleyrodidarum MED (Bemisia tabaci)]AUI73068.1 hypothetical protein BA952_00980 [Candidatus Portiera aleyrodidarum]AUI73310.1 hypothetical protein BBB03_01005 [Candidatus Portiera aleyrodidarum]